MKEKLLFVLLPFVLMLSCKKKETTVARHDPQSYTEAMDSVHITYEQVYIYTGSSTFHDTIIFHKDGSITEKTSYFIPRTSITYKPQYLNTYYYIYSNPFGRVEVRMLPIQDTDTKMYPLHDMLIKDTIALYIQNWYHPGTKNIWRLEGEYKPNSYYSVAFTDEYQ